MKNAMREREEWRLSCTLSLCVEQLSRLVFVFTFGYSYLNFSNVSSYKTQRVFEVKEQFDPIPFHQSSLPTATQGIQL